MFTINYNFAARLKNTIYPIKELLPTLGGSNLYDSHVVFTKNSSGIIPVYDRSSFIVSNRQGLNSYIYAPVSGFVPTTSIHSATYNRDYVLGDVGGMHLRTGLYGTTAGTTWNGAQSSIAQVTAGYGGVVYLKYATTSTDPGVVPGNCVVLGFCPNVSSNTNARMHFLLTTNSSGYNGTYSLSTSIPTSSSKYVAFKPDTPIDIYWNYCNSRYLVVYGTSWDGKQFAAYVALTANSNTPYGSYANGNIGYYGGEYNKVTFSTLSAGSSPVVTIDASVTPNVNSAFDSFELSVFGFPINHCNCESLNSTALNSSRSCPIDFAYHTVLSSSTPNWNWFSAQSSENFLRNHNLGGWSLNGIVRGYRTPLPWWKDPMSKGQSFSNGSTLPNGSTFRKTISKLSGGPDSSTTTNSIIKYIVFKTAVDSTVVSGWTSLATSIYAKWDAVKETIFVYSTSTTMELPSDMSYMFYYFTGLRSISGLNSVICNRSGITNFQNVFSSDYQLIELTGVSYWRFVNCSFWDTFDNCYNLKYIRGIGTWYGTYSNFGYAFYGCRALRTFPNFKKLRLTTATTTGQYQYSFYNCYYLDNIQLLTWDSTNNYFNAEASSGNAVSYYATVTTLNGMFYNCTRLRSVFFGPGFSGNPTVIDMFNNCPCLETVYFGDAANNTIGIFASAPWGTVSPGSSMTDAQKQTYENNMARMFGGTTLTRYNDSATSPLLSETKNMRRIQMFSGNTYIQSYIYNGFSASHTTNYNNVCWGVALAQASNYRAQFSNYSLTSGLITQLVVAGQIIETTGTGWNYPDASKVKANSTYLANFKKWKGIILIPHSRFSAGSGIVDGQCNANAAPVACTISTTASGNLWHDYDCVDTKYYRSVTSLYCVDPGSTNAYYPIFAARLEDRLGNYYIILTSPASKFEVNTYGICQQRGCDILPTDFTIQGYEHVIGGMQTLYNIPVSKNGDTWIRGIQNMSVVGAANPFYAMREAGNLNPTTFKGSDWTFACAFNIVPSKAYLTGRNSQWGSNYTACAYEINWSNANADKYDWGLDLSGISSMQSPNYTEKYQVHPYCSTSHGIIGYNTDVDIDIHFGDTHRQCYGCMLPFASLTTNKITTNSAAHVNIYGGATLMHQINAWRTTYITASSSYITYPNTKIDDHFLNYNRHGCVQSDKNQVTFIPE